MCFNKASIFFNVSSHVFYVSSNLYQKTSSSKIVKFDLISFSSTREEWRKTCKTLKILTTDFFFHLIIIL